MRSSPPIRRARWWKVPIRNITEFGLFIGLDGGVDGMVHLSDLDWNKSGDEAIKDYKKGDNVKAVVLDVDRTKERISSASSRSAAIRWRRIGKLKKGDAVTCEVIAVRAERHPGDASPTPTSPPTSSVPTCRATAPSSGPSATMSATRWMPPSSASTRTAAASRCRSRRWRSPRRSRPWRSTARPTRAHRSATSSRRRSRSATSDEDGKE